MSEFPPELLHEILVRLPPDDLIRCLSVSKPWNSFIRQHSFVKSHLRRSLQTDSNRIMVIRYYPLPLGKKGFYCTLPFEDDDDTLPTTDPVKIEQPLKCIGDSYTISIGNSVDGLLFLLNDARKRFGLWNPSIQKLKTIPFPPTTIELQKSRFPSRCCGFGYDSVSDDYKLAYIAFTAECLVTNVYSLKHNSWKTMIQNNTPHFWHDVSCLHFEEVSVLGGALCWMVNKPSDDRRHKHKYVILTFDLATEEYVEFRTPIDEYQYKYQYPRPTLAVLGGLLCIHVVYEAGVRDVKQDVWIMKEYGVAESWTLLFSLVEPSVRGLLAFSKNRERVLFLASEMPFLPDSDGFYWYDLGEKKISHLGFKPGLKDCYTPTVCVRSLCLLDGDPVRAPPSRKRRRGRRRS